MSREEFLRQLEQELRTLSVDERKSAMQYYQDYLNEAEDIESALRSLGSPQAVAADILREFGSVPAALSRRKGTGDFRKRFSSMELGQKILLIFLICVAAICILPVCVGVVGGVGGALIGIVICIVVVLFAAFLVFLVLAFAFFIAGLATLFCIPALPTLAGSVIVVGTSLILFGLSLLCFAAFLWLCRTLLPAMVRTVANFGRRLFSGGVS